MTLFLLSLLFQFQLIEKDFISINSFKAEFEQIYSYTGGKEQIKERGLIYFKKPSLFRWEYKEPEKKIFILKGDEILTFFPEEGLIQRERVTDDMIEIFSILTGGKISDYFDLKEKDCSPMQCTILYPKQRRDFNSIEIKYFKGEIKEIIVKFDYSENRIILKKFLKNIKIPPQIFNLEDI